MSPLKNYRNKRFAELQFPSSSLLGSDHLHIAKKPKSANGMIPTTSSVSRLNLYPKQVSPIYREIKAPILVVKGITANPPKFDTSFSHYLNSRRFSGNLDNGGFRMGNEKFLDYRRKREEALRGCLSFEVDKDGKIVEDVDNDNDGEGDSGVEKEDFNKSVEIQTIRAKNKELDGKAEGNLRFQPSTSSGVVSNLVDGKALESLSLNRMDVDDGVPLHRKVLNESARKHAGPLRNLNYDIELVEEKKASFDKLRPAKKVEFIRSSQLFKVEKDDEVVEDVDNDNNGEGDSGVKEVEKESFNKSFEIQTIRAKSKELDGKTEGNLRFQPSTFSGGVSNLVDGKALESLSLNRVDVDDGVPLYRKLIIELARKNAVLSELLRNLDYDIKLVKEKKALFDKMRPAKKEEDVLVSDSVDGKVLDSLLLNQRSDVGDVDDGMPLHRKLPNESAREHVEPLTNLNYDIKLVEEKKALFDEMCHAKKEEDVLVSDSLDRKVLESLSLNQRSDVVYVDDGVPLHRKLPTVNQRSDVVDVEDGVPLHRKLPIPLPTANERPDVVGVDNGMSLHRKLPIPRHQLITGGSRWEALISVARRELASLKRRGEEEGACPLTV